MKSSRKKMLERIRAMLNTDGRTEAEMMAFLAKARELMATYEIDEDDLKEFEREEIKLHKGEISDPYEIKRRLSLSIAKFTRCEGFGGYQQGFGISFCGMESDVIFATWLLETLQRFVMRALREYQKQRSIKKFANSNLISVSFVAGCVNRIEQKLKELTPIHYAKNRHLIKAKLAEQGLVLRDTSKNENLNTKSMLAGHAAGNHARFDKPVSQGGTLRLK